MDATSASSEAEPEYNRQVSSDSPTLDVENKVSASPVPQSQRSVSDPMEVLPSTATISDEELPFKFLHSYDDSPFVTSTPINKYEIVKVVVMTLLGVPFLRIGLSLPFFLLSWMFSVFATVGVDESKPHSRVRRFWTACMRVMIRCTLFFWGFYWITIKRPPGKDFPRARALTCNHISLLDAAFLMGTDWGVAAKTEAHDSPFTGRMIQALQGIRVDRVSTPGREASLRAIVDRIKDHTYPPLLVFPQGTTCNQRWLTFFKRGVFTAGEPIQPVVLRFHASHFDMTWLYDTHPLVYVWRMFCQVGTRVSVEYLPVYFPNEAEKSDPQLFAANLRNIYALALGARTTQHTFDDVRLRYEALKSNIKYFNFFYSELAAVSHLKFEGFEELVKEFHALDKDHNGFINFAEFATLFKLSEDSTLAKRVFDIFDADHSGQIDFGEFIVGVCLVAGRCTPTQAVKLCFRVFDRNADGLVDREEFTQLLYRMMPQAGRTERQHAQHQELVDKWFPSADTKLSLEQFALFMQQNSELANEVLRATISVHTPRRDADNEV